MTTEFDLNAPKQNTFFYDNYLYNAKCSFFVIDTFKISEKLSRLYVITANHCSESLQQYFLLTRFKDNAKANSGIYKTILSDQKMDVLIIAFDSKLKDSEFHTLIPVLNDSIVNNNKNIYFSSKYRSIETFKNVFWPKELDCRGEYKGRNSTQCNSFINQLNRKYDHHFVSMHSILIFPSYDFLALSQASSLPRMSGSPGIALDHNITDMNNHQFEKKFQFILLGFRTFDKNGKIFPATIYLNTATVEFKIFYKI